MLEWIKLESSILLDSRIQALLDDHGFCGLGIYVAMRTAIDSICEDGLPLPQVLAVGVPRTRKNKMQCIIENYGLFEVSSLGIVTCLPLTPAHISGQTPALIPGLTSGQEPSVERKEEKQTIVRFRKPSLAEISEYCQSRHNGIDPQRFYDYQEARGWMLGKSKMKDWKAAVRTWERRPEGPLGRALIGSESSEGDYPQPAQNFSAQQIPDWAPPRPSPTAQWDFATDSWNDFY